jgi:type II secretory ATPase GspE/PulE/Tfp pilus assembly ATPase PilB-like protein
MAYVEQEDLKAKIAALHRAGEERAAERLAAKFGLTYADLSKTPITLEAVRILSEDDARNSKTAVVQSIAKKIALAVVNPELPATKKIIETLTAKNYEVKVVVVSPSGLELAWHFYKFIKPESEVITGKVVIPRARLEELTARLVSLEIIQKEFAGLDFSKVAPMVIVEIIFAGALKIRASDVHLEAGEKKGKIRFRIDGVLHDAFTDLPLGLYRNVIGRIKLLSGMKININDEAQDGRFTIALLDKEVEMRVSVIPGEFDETIVMRILDPQATMVGLPELGLREDNLELVRKEISRPNGLILNTGPTGSGKTTTLYAFLRSINKPEIKIITLEDPIEYRMDGVEQTQVDDEAGYTFANGLRAIVRQDPDVILVGEVRDLETADIALQASLTGHLVFSTLHTNDAVGAVPRLINLGVKAVSIGPAISLIIAQRLVRILCPQCKKPNTTDETTKAKIKKFLDGLPAQVNKKAYENYAVYEPVGCLSCSGIGYKGRVGIFEFLKGTEELQEVILKEASEVVLRTVARNQGMVTMQQDGILKVLMGQTTLSEVEEATGEIEW